MSIINEGDTPQEHVAPIQPPSQPETPKEASSRPSRSIKKWISIIVVVGLLVALIASLANTKKLDASSDMAWDLSKEEMRKSLSPLDQKRLGHAIKILLQDQRTMREVEPGVKQRMGKRNARQQLNGMSFGDLLDAHLELTGEDLRDLR